MTEKKKPVLRSFFGARPRILNPAFRSAQVVNVSEIPLTMRERSMDPVIERIYRLPRGQGLMCPVGGVPRHVAEARQTQLSLVGRRLGKPVTTRLRCLDGIGYVIYAFKRHDLTKRRNGKETR